MIFSLRNLPAHDALSLLARMFYMRAVLHGRRGQIVTIVNPLHHYHRPAHLQHVIAEMRRLGPLRIRAYFDGEVQGRHASTASGEGCRIRSCDGACSVASDEGCLGSRDVPVFERVEIGVAQGNVVVTLK